MKLIEQDMLRAIDLQTNWQRDNTKVTWSPEGCTVKLHSTLIASIKGNILLLSDAGKRSKITQSRLKAILHHYNLGSILSKNNRWIYSLYGQKTVWQGSLVLNIKPVNQSFIINPFTKDFVL